MAVHGEVPVADVPPVPQKLVDALIQWHGKVLEVGHQTFPLVAQRQDAPLTQIETLAHGMRQMESLGAVVRHELRLHYRSVKAAYRESAA